MSRIIMFFFFARLISTNKYSTQSLKNAKKVAVAPMFHFMYASYSFTSLRLELLVIELKRPERRNFLLFDQVAFIICEQIYKEI